MTSPSLIRSIEHITSSAVIGEPSLNMMPGRRWNVQVMASSDDFPRLGQGADELACLVLGSRRACRTSGRWVPRDASAKAIVGIEALRRLGADEADRALALSRHTRGRRRRGRRGSRRRSRGRSRCAGRRGCRCAGCGGAGRRSSGRRGGRRGRTGGSGRWSSSCRRLCGRRPARAHDERCADDGGENLAAAVRLTVCPPRRPWAPSPLGISHRA